MDAMTDDVYRMPHAVDGSDLGQGDFIERAAQVLSRDDRILGVWLTGSYGRGTNDRFSDVDLWVVVEPEDVISFGEDWPTICDDIAPTVLRKQVPGRPVFTQVTSDWVRFDLTIGTPHDIERRTTITLHPLYDPAGLSSQLGEPGPGRQPDPDKVASLTQEFLRVLGLLPVVVGREEYVVAELGAGLALNLLVDLMLEDVLVEDRGGAMHLNRLLPSEQRQSLLDLPPIDATRTSVIDAHLACAALFIPLARDLHTRCKLAWPQAIEDALRRHLDKTLTITLPA